MNICLINNLFYPIETGSSRFVFKLARLLINKGHNVTVIATKFEKSPEYEVIDEIHIYRISGIKLPQIPLAHNFKWFALTIFHSRKRVSNIINERKIQIIHLHGHIFDIGLHAVRLKKKYKIPLVLTIHLMAVHTNKFYNKILKNLDICIAKPLIINKCDKLIAPDHNINNYLHNRFGKDNTELIPYFFDINTVNKNYSTDCLNKYNLLPDSYIISVGHIQELRNREDLIRSLTILKNDFPNIKLVIAGKILRQKTVGLVKTLGLKNMVIFTDYISNEEILCLIRHSILVAQWGSYSNAGGLGFASLEAMALEKTVMTLPGKELIYKKEITNWNEVVVAHKDNPSKIAQDMIRLINDETLRKNIGINARKYIEKKFDSNAIYLKTIKLYNDLTLAR